MLWLAKQEHAMRYARAQRDGMEPSPVQLERFMMARSRGRSRGLSRDNGPMCLTIAGDVAQITVDGLLTPQPDWLAWYLYGNTAYSDIREALAEASMNDDVKRVQWMFSSPGGMVDGFFDLLPAIETFQKPAEVLASMACSAAFGLAAMAGKITATSPGSEFGSVGVVRTYFADGPAASELQIDVTSTAAPNKRPDVTTPEGLAVVRQELDVQHDLLADAIARGRTRAGRKTSKAQVNSDFGLGGSVYAEDAAAKGMIDRAPPRKPRGATSSASADLHETETPPVPPALAATETNAPEIPPVAAPQPAPVAGAPTKVKSKMNKKELQEQHPEVYASIVAEGRAAGVTEGTNAERDRCVAHLTMGEASGDMKTAITAVTDGSGMTATMSAKYQAASMNRADQRTRQGESDEAEAATRGAKPPAPSGGTLLEKFESDLGPAKPKAG